MAKLAKPVDDRHVTVEVWLDETSQPIILAALNTYTKGPMYCVYTVSGRVHKFPVAHLFRAIEDYDAPRKREA